MRFINIEIRYLQLPGGTETITPLLPWTCRDQAGMFDPRNVAPLAYFIKGVAEHIIDCCRIHGVIPVQWFMDGLDSHWHALVSLWIPPQWIDVCRKRFVVNWYRDFSVFGLRKMPSHDWCCYGAMLLMLDTYETTTCSELPMIHPQPITAIFIIK